MTIREYINSIEIDEIKFFQKNRNSNPIYVYSEGENKYFDKYSNQGSSNINIEEFEEKITSGDYLKLKSYFKEAKNEYLLSPNHNETSSIIKFLKNGKLRGQLNCNFMRSQFLTKENERLIYCMDDIKNLFTWTKENGYKIERASLFFQNHYERNISNNLMYPKSFYFNSNFNVFETSLYINLNSINTKSWRLEIRKIEERPTVNQLKSIDKLIANSWEVRKMILDKLFNYYQTTARIDFELPELSNQEQLFYFMRSGTISMLENEETLTIAFGTWDEEHGAYYSYFVNENRIEEKLRSIIKAKTSSEQ